MVYVIDELPGLTLYGMWAVAAHPAGLWYKDACRYCFQHRNSNFAEALSVLCGASGVDLLQLWLFKFAEYVEAAAYRSCWEYILFAGQQNTITGHLEIGIGCRLRHRFRGRL